jgi:hypothetical protein
LFPEDVLIHKTIWIHDVNKQELNKNYGHKLHATDNSLVPQIKMMYTLWFHRINKHQFKTNGDYKIHGSDQLIVPII